MKRLVLLLAVLVLTPAHARCPSAVLAIGLAALCVGPGCNSVKEGEAPAAPVVTAEAPDLSTVGPNAAHTVTPLAKKPLEATDLRRLVDENTEIPKTLSSAARKEIFLLRVQLTLTEPVLEGRWRDAVARAKTVVPEYQDVFVDNGLFFDGLAALASGAETTPPLEEAIRAYDSKARARINALLQGKP